MQHPSGLPTLDLTDPVAVLRYIVQVLSTGGCRVNECDVCKQEAHEARSIARDALVAMGHPVDETGFPAKYHEETDDRLD